MFSQLRSKLYWWHFILSLVVLKYGIECFIYIRQYLKLADPARHTDAAIILGASSAEAYGKACASAYRMFWLSFVKSFFPLIFFGIGIFPASWTWFRTRLPRMNSFALSAIFYGMFYAIVEGINIGSDYLATKQHSLNWEFWKAHANSLALSIIFIVLARFTVGISKGKQLSLAYLMVLINKLVLTLIGQNRLQALVKQCAVPALPQNLADLCDRCGFPKSNVILSTLVRSLTNGGFPSFFIFLKVNAKNPDVRLELQCLEATLAHELGHWKLGHLWFDLALNLVRDLVAATIFLLVIDRPAMYRSLGFQVDPKDRSTLPLGVGLIVAYMLQAFFKFFTAPLIYLINAAEEYQADAFAVKLGYKDWLSDALVKDSSESLGLFFLDVAYIMFEANTHPPLTDRVRALLTG